MTEESAALLALGVVFTTGFALSFLLLQRWQATRDMRRRTRGMALAASTASPQRALHANKAQLQKILQSVSKQFANIDPTRAKKLRSQLLQAGLYDPLWVPGFFALRFAFCVAAGVLGYVVVVPLLAFEDTNSAFISYALLASFGYMLPVIWLSKRIARFVDDHRAGFPDFMDLLVVCADAGISMEQALVRVSQELMASYPSLSTNLHFTVLEMRAGKTTSVALEHLGHRLGLEEAQSFATLLQQSEELGSNLSDALRVYSDEMRHKRLSRAEEKAHALPAKLVVPMGLFIFPVLFVVILLPVALKVSNMQ